jgi:hypothetical protein
MSVLATAGILAVAVAAFLVKFALAGRREARRAAEALAEKERKLREPAAKAQRKRSERESAVAAIEKNPARAVKALRTMIGNRNRD